MIGRGLAAIGFVLSLPVWPVVAAIVWASVGRPVLFRQQRAGLHRRSFTLVKFRTMTNACDGHGQLFPDAQRQTAATRLLRRLRLDELPQLLMILRGDMALVGPRPLFAETIDHWGELGRQRCAVRPGMTGWAQIHGNTKLTEDEKLALDLWYVRHRSLAIDLKILALTVATIIRGERVKPEMVRRAIAGLAAGRQATARPRANG
ncbi:sugar transferase [Jiella sp. MQZ9-1]|uniref:Sugar transferase n=1 Tax=Jiella flava TaxID=2816857 RepID=A0A939JUC4_9HYPH|nr:sugar transferase [Jiella flava]MBO0663035.1 sugar transferase [Jiella flava]MCD2471454.1 sugar transferase [Jiella flava]